MRAYHPQRDLRVSLQGVDNETAVRLIAQHQPLIQAAVRRYARVARRAFHPVDRDDLERLAEAAVLEAYVTYREGDMSRERTPEGGLRSHIGRVVWWRLSDAVARVRQAEPAVGERGDVVDTLPEGRMNGYAASRAFYLRTMMEALREGLGRQCSVRQRLIVVGILRGETQNELAQQFGVSPGRISQEYRTALQALREWLEARGFDSLELDS